MGKRIADVCAAIKTLSAQDLCALVWRRPSPPSAAASNHLFFYKNSASISIPFLISEGRAGAGGRERAAVISTEAGLVLRGIRDTQVFSQRALCRALLEPSSIPVCQTTLSRGVRYPEPVSNAKSSNRGEKKKQREGGGKKRDVGKKERGKMFLFEEKGSCSNLAVSF